MKNSLLEITNFLNSKQYHTGTAIGAQLGITRSAVWKAIKKLQFYGVNIISKGKEGYFLAEPLVLLNQTLLQKKIKNMQIEVFENITSTNDYLLSQTKTTHPRLCLAEQQTQGRGRLGRQWYSPFGRNIYLSLQYPMQKDISELAGLSLIVGLATAKTLQPYLGKEKCGVKWPNDVICQHKKLAGNLIEVQAEAHYVSQVIIGIGMNVNVQKKAGKSIDQPWTSLLEVTGKYTDRNALAVVLVENLLSYLQRFEQQGLAPFLKEWEKLDVLFHQKISVKNLNHITQGQAQGINAHGQLLLKLPNGKVQAFSSGDTSLHHSSNS